jgi:hypothetical protein
VDSANTCLEPVGQLGRVIRILVGDRRALLGAKPKKAAGDFAEGPKPAGLFSPISAGSG